MLGKGEGLPRIRDDVDKELFFVRKRKERKKKKDL